MFEISTLFCPIMDVLFTSKKYAWIPIGLILVSGLIHMITYIFRKSAISESKFNFSWKIKKKQK